MTPKSLTCVLGGFTVCAAIVVLNVLRSPDCVAFEGVHHAHAVLADRGFVCTSDRSDGQVVSGFMVSRTPTTWTEVNGIAKVGPMGPAWHGKVWVTSRVSGSYPNAGMPYKAKPRLWGKVFAFGDEEVLDELELALQSNGVFGFSTT